MARWTHTVLRIDQYFVKGEEVNEEKKMEIDSNGNEKACGKICRDKSKTPCIN